MSFGTGQVIVGNTPTLIVAAQTRNLLSLVHNGGSDVYLGGSTVTAATGSLLTGTKGTPFTTTGPDAYYGITASGTGLVSYIEQS